MQLLGVRARDNAQMSRYRRFLFGGGFGYHRWGYNGGIGIGGVLLIVLVVYLLVGRGRL
jgi:hypothetical protein